MKTFHKGDLVKYYYNRHVELDIFKAVIKDNWKQSKKFQSSDLKRFVYEVYIEPVVGIVLEGPVFKLQTYNSNDYSVVNENEQSALCYYKVFLKQKYYWINDKCLKQI